MTTFQSQDIIPLLDLTSLNHGDSEFDIQKLCKKAATAQGHVAAVCIYPHLVPVAHRALHEAGLDDIAVATVVNFPHGRDSEHKVISETNHALDHGATEIDVVMPYEALLQGDEETPASLLKAVCEATHQRGGLVKVILETGALQTEEYIILACEIAIAAGADFLKTSTGKIDIGATPEAVDLMIEAVNAEHVSRQVGIKISGGVRTKADAQSYLELIESRMQKAWITPDHVRIGASSLLDELLNNA